MAKAGAWGGCGLHEHQTLIPSGGATKYHVVPGLQVWDPWSKSTLTGLRCQTASAPGTAWATVENSNRASAVHWCPSLQTSLGWPQFPSCLLSAVCNLAANEASSSSHIVAAEALKWHNKQRGRRTVKNIRLFNQVKGLFFLNCVFIIIIMEKTVINTCISPWALGKGVCLRTKGGAGGALGGATVMGRTSWGGHATDC